MDDLISRAAAIDAILGSFSAIRAIEELPAVDAALHGRWLDERPNTYMRKVKCSVCNESAPFICMSEDYYGRNMHGDFAKTKYCPCCGAKMMNSPMWEVDGERRDDDALSGR
jgi:hypothetical protein